MELPFLSKARVEGGVTPTGVHAHVAAPAVGVETRGHHYEEIEGEGLHVYLTGGTTSPEPRGMLATVTRTMEGRTHVTVYHPVTGEPLTEPIEITEEGR